MSYEELKELQKLCNKIDGLKSKLKKAVDNKNEIIDFVCDWIEGCVGEAIPMKDGDRHFKNEDEISEYLKTQKD